jgi:hypothetical protein
LAGRNSGNWLADFGNFWGGYTRGNSNVGAQQSHQVAAGQRQILDPNVNNGSRYALPLQPNTQNTLMTQRNEPGVVGNVPVLRPPVWHQGSNAFNNTIFAGASWASENYEPEIFNIR